MHINEHTLHSKLATTQHVVTVEISPPKGTDVKLFLDRIRPLKPYVDAVNIPDCQRGILKMSAMAASKLVQDELGVETVWQLTGRDRNLLALQADLMGAWALGIRNVLALTGDPVSMGDHAQLAKQVSHLDALRMLDLLALLNDGKDATETDLPKGGTLFTVGCALNPHKMSRDAQLHRLQYKLSRGVQFLQTQPIYNIETLMETQQVIGDLCGKLQCAKPKLLVGMIPPKSADFARFMNQKIVGVSIPGHFIDLLEKSLNPVAESIAFCGDLVDSMAPHTEGFHFMPVGMEKHAPAMLERCLTSLRRPPIKENAA